MITQKGQSIEDKSMEIIENEIGSHPYSKDEWPIVRRVIHSTADSSPVATLCRHKTEPGLER